MSDFTNTRISERLYYDKQPIAFTADGTDQGVVNIPSTYGFKVNQKVTLQSDVLQPRNYKVKKVISETQLVLGSFEKPRSEDIDISDFLVTENAVIILYQQNRPSIDPVNIQGMVFEEEPTVALRNHLVDWLGRSYDASNPVPVQLSDGSIDIGTVNAELEVQLSHQNNVQDPGDIADSVQIGDGVEILQVNPDGSINVNIVLAGNGVSKNIYNEVSSVASSTTTSIVTYTVPLGKKATLNLVEFTGSNIGTYEVRVNGSNIAKKRTWFNGNMSGEFNFSSFPNHGIILSAGDIIRLRVTHDRPMVGDFEGRILLVEE